MSDNPFFSQNGPTEPIPPSASQQPDQQSNKLRIGNFQSTQRNAERKPYQIPQQPPQSQPQNWQPSPGRRGGTPPNQYSRQQVPASNVPTPTVNPNAQPYRQQPGQVPSVGTPKVAAPRGKRPLLRRRGCLITLLVVLLVVVVLSAFTFTTTQRVLAFGSAISTQSPLSSQTGYMGTSDRVNLLVMGYGGTGHDGAYLTDSMVVMSLLPSSHHTTLISVPRDLWVQIPSGSGQYHKINYVYTYGSNNGANAVGGGTAAVQKVSAVTGLDVKYWLTINFQGFRDFINAIGGVDVYVPDSFNACYPKNDDASVDPSWIKIQFNKGLQHMNGATAIMYARAREPVEVCGKGTSENQAELTDFGRSARQQIIIKAALDKVKQTSTWPSLYNALTALQRAVYTNLSLADLAEFALKMDLTNAHRVGLSNQNVLVDATAPDGEYILQPASSWQAVQDYVKQQLYN